MPTPGFARIRIGAMTEHLLDQLSEMEEQTD